MPDYHACVVGSEGDFVAVHEFAAADRRGAAWIALKFVEQHPIELWEGEEYVGTFTPGNPGSAPRSKRPARRW